MPEATTALEQLRVQYVASVEAARKAGQLKLFPYLKLKAAGKPRNWNSYNDDIDMTIGEAVQSQLVESGVEAGVIPAGTDPKTINWQNLIDFINQLMPVIKELITFIMTLFGG
jgi:hypothetical protein